MGVVFRLLLDDPLEAAIESETSTQGVPVSGGRSRGTLIRLGLDGGGKIDGMNNTYVIWALISLATALVLLVLELLIPSGGILGLAVAVATVTGVVLLFMADTTLGLTGALGVLISMPFVLGFALRIWPHTPVAKWLTLRTKVDAAASPSSDSSPSGSDSSSDSPSRLVGAVEGGGGGARGVALTDLRPVGFCRINGRRVECLAEYGVIRAGTQVQVVRILDDQTIVAAKPNPA